jgi:hypothetical protein
MAQIVVTHTKTKKRYVFPCSMWLAKVEIIFYRLFFALNLFGSI